MSSQKVRMAEPKQERDGESPSEEDDNNQRDTNQRTDGQQGARQEPSGEEYGYSLESDSGSHQSQTAGRDDEEEQEEVPVATQTTDHQCGRRGPICGIASQLPFLLTTAANQAGQEALSSEENRQLRRVQRNDEDQRDLLQNQQNAHEDRNLFQLPGWTETGRRVQQCTEQHPPGGVFCDLRTGDPQVGSLNSTATFECKTLTIFALSKSTSHGGSPVGEK